MTLLPCVQLNGREVYDMRDVFLLLFAVLLFMVLCAFAVAYMPAIAAVMV